MRCGCGTVATGPTIIANSACVSSSGAGTSADPFSLAPVVDSDIRNLFSCGVDGMAVANPESPGEWTAYTPGWHSTGTAPTLGDGLLAGLYRKSGQSLEVEIILVFGSTTTAGTGVYFWDLPAGLICGFTGPVSMFTYVAGSAVKMGIALAQGTTGVIGAPVLSDNTIVSGAGQGAGSTYELAGTVYVTT